MHSSYHFLGTGVSPAWHFCHRFCLCGVLFGSVQAALLFLHGVMSCLRVGFVSESLAFVCQNTLACQPHQPSAALQRQIGAAGGGLPWNGMRTVEACRP